MQAINENNVQIPINKANLFIAFITVCFLVGAPVYFFGRTSEKIDNLTLQVSRLTEVIENKSYYKADAAKDLLVVNQRIDRIEERLRKVEGKE